MSELESFRLRPSPSAPYDGAPPPITGEAIRTNLEDLFPLMIVGLTGSIGMGKSTAARMLRQMGVPVYDADANVHAVQAPGGAALPAIEAAFPGVVKDGVLDRQALGARVFGNREALRRLEAIVHPLVGQRQRAFLKRAALRRERLVVLDIPLLFEGMGDRRVDAPGT